MLLRSYTSRLSSFAVSLPIFGFDPTNPKARNFVEFVQFFAFTKSEKAVFERPFFFLPKLENSLWLENQNEIQEDVELETYTIQPCLFPVLFPVLSHLL